MDAQVQVLAVLQGLTEFLPISSSAHLVVVRAISGWEYPALAIHVSAHLGTLFAVLVYCRRELLLVARGGLGLLVGARDPAAHSALLLIIATLPLLAIGWLESQYRFLVRDHLETIAWASIGFGILLWLSDRFFATIRRLEHLSLRGALVIGLVQVAALIPGASRAGLTMMAGRWFGLERDEAARFSLLLSVPAILGASLLAGIELWQIGDVVLTRQAALVTVFSMGVALPSIALMIAWLRRSGFGVFAVYRILFGLAILYYVHRGSPTILF